MKEELAESIFGCLERIEDKLDKQPVQTEQGENEDNRNLAEAIVPLVDSMNRTNRNLCVVRDVLKIISDRQKKDKEELHTRLDALSERNDDAVTAEIRDLKNVVSEKTSKPQYKKVTHDLTTKTWYLVGIGTILFFCMSLLTTKIYDQSKEIDELEVAG